MVSAFARGQAAIGELSCDILITAHADQDDATGRFLTAPGSCRAYASSSQRKLAQHLSSERR
ncbi:hypothetical protein [Sphingomonas paucimobilis]|uniref:hypothetical protein n=1 Tax=Sphingomonas paucimobilis TaxID=13689 RepID=UPI0028D85E3B|nr:hypothetical protein [Sphingomonas paucimobilis]